MSGDLFEKPAPAEPALCYYCSRAKSGLSGLYYVSCAGCRAREIARGPLFFAAKNATTADEWYWDARAAYRAALVAANVTHEQVKEWSA